MPAPRTRRRRWEKKAGALEGAAPGDPPEGPFEPQLARLGDTPPRGGQWLHELKWDGYRILATVADGEPRLWSRNALEWTGKLPEIRDAIEALGLESAALDGELIAGSGGTADFNLLQSTLSGERQDALALVLFDLLHIDGVDISEAPLAARKALLQELLEGAPRQLAYSSHIEGDGEAAFELAAEGDFEGIISKRGDRPYRGGRGSDWRKTKRLASDKFAVVGYTAPKGSRTGFGSLLLARPDPKHGWRYAGRVGTGFSEELMREVTGKIGSAGGKTPTAHVGTTDTDLRGAKWFAPRFVVEVFFRGVGRQQLLRQASLKAVRWEKDVDDLDDSDRRTPRRAPRDAKAASARQRRKKAAAAEERPLPALSSPTKVLFPDDGITKQQVWDYYAAVLDHLLPEIAGRPLSVVRCPSDVDKPCFFQKHHTAGLELVSSVKLKEESGANAFYLVVEDAAALMELVQFNALEFHPWGAHAEEPDIADRVVFDLDPGPGVPFEEVRRAARDIRRLLAGLELESFLRVSGGKGLHVVVPLRPGCDWGLTKRFAHGFADALAQSEPHRFLATASKRLRNKRIFVDYLRNGRGATAVASYSLRGRPRAPVALPVSWNELGRIRRADAFTIKDVPGKLRRRRKDPWEGIDAIEQDLSRWAES